MTKEYDISKLSSIELALGLSQIFGPTGCEDRVALALYDEAKRLCDKAHIDRMGNVYGVISLGDSDKRKKVMLSAHTDEVGFMIEEIKRDGTLTFATLGGIDPSVVAGRNVLVGNEEKLYRGIICSKAIHHKSKSERSSAEDIEKLYIDIGATDKESAESCVSVGDFATFESKPIRFGKDAKTVKSKALDDRMGCALLVELMRKIKSEPPSVDLDIYFCFTVGEETGHSGAIIASERISPDFALIFESTAVGDIPDAPSNKRVAELSKGAVISVADRSTIYDKELIDLAFSLAKEKDIPLQVKKYLSGGNDAGHIHKSGKGVRALAVSIPTRYLHSPACVAHADDYDSAKRIAFELLLGIDKL
ncbi:MAG: M20/M25/M40 family metallo-hydrolase [Clostridia bacterium]|nr:M20/M25/M40 family metallo-hydrolase [Clostridia bacterium]